MLLIILYYITSTYQQCHQTAPKGLEAHCNAADVVKAYSLGQAILFEMHKQLPQGPVTHRLHAKRVATH